MGERNEGAVYSTPVPTSRNAPSSSKIGSVAATPAGIAGAPSKFIPFYGLIMIPKGDTRDFIMNGIDAIKINGITVVCGAAE